MHKMTMKTATLLPNGIRLVIHLRSDLVLDASAAAVTIEEALVLVGACRGMCPVILAVEEGEFQVKAFIGWTSSDTEKRKTNAAATIQSLGFRINH